MSDYTPTTEQVRDHWGAGGASEEGFDRWLAQHDAEVEAKVRAQIAADIQAARDLAAARLDASDPWDSGALWGMFAAADIAKGGA